MIELDPQRLFEMIAAHVPSELHDNLLIVGSLAAADVGDELHRSELSARGGDFAAALRAETLRNPIHAELCLVRREMWMAKYSSRTHETDLFLARLQSRSPAQPDPRPEATHSRRAIGGPGSYSRPMSEPRSAEDFWPEIVKLSHDEQVRLAKLALRAAALGSDAARYRAAPPRPDEFSTDDDPLAWEGEGWERFRAPG